jgi:broad specificity phosphatase PhoE
MAPIDMSSTRLLLVRHGETDDNRKLVFQGQSGSGLNERGRAQAARLAARLVDSRVKLDALYCSDLERARETAEILGSSLALRPVVDAELREVNLGAWQGLSRAEVEARFPEEWAAWRRGVDVPRGGGETYTALGERMAGALGRLAARHAGGVVGVVSHGAAIKTFVAGALRLELGGMSVLQVLRNTGLSVLERNPNGQHRLIVWNDATHLEDALTIALAASSPWPSPP